MADRSILVRHGRSLVEAVEYALERRLPVKGTIYAKLGDAVKPETVVGESKVSAGFRVFSLVEYLGGSAKQVKQAMRRTLGSRVYQGDVIAERSTLMGMKKRQFVSPIDGVVQALDESTGQLTMQFAPVTYRLPAGVRGEVTQVVPDEAVFIKTAASLIFGVYASGVMREGALRVVAAADEMISAKVIDSRLAGYIIGGGSGITRDALNRALAVGVKGVVTGGIAAADLLAVSGSLHGKEDVGISLLITGGLGSRPMEQGVYEFLKGHSEQQVFILPNQKMLLAPLPLDKQQGVRPLEAVPEHFGQLEVGDKVRVLCGVEMGLVAEVAAIGSVRPVSGSRLAVPHCLLTKDGGATIEVPVTNIELLS